MFMSDMGNSGEKRGAEVSTMLGPAIGDQMSAIISPFPRSDQMSLCFTTA